MPDSLAAVLSVVHSHPVWLVEHWLELFGKGPTEALLQANNWYGGPRHLIGVPHDPGSSAARQMLKCATSCSQSEVLRSHGQDVGTLDG